MNNNATRFDDDEIEIDLLQLFRALKKRILWIIGAGVLFGGAFGAFSKFVITPQYTSTAMVYILSKETTLTSLADLRHFDSLQVLCVNSKNVSTPLQDLTGLEKCRNLVYLTLPSVESGAFAAFAEMDSVVKLMYGSNNHLKMLWITGSEVDLAQLAGANLRTLTLDVTRIKSLEPLQQMPQLKVLQLVKGPEFPSFEPLDGSSIQYLDLSVPEGAAHRYKAMDLTPLARMPQLVWLNLMNHASVDSELCRQILAAEIFIDAT